MVASTFSRFCLCGCGQRIDHMHTNAQYLQSCRKRREAEQSKARRATQPSVKSQFPRQNYVRAGNDGNPNRKQKLCPACCGMPWARLEERLTDSGHEVSVDGQRCRVCGELYAPEPKPEPMSVLVSSGALAAKEGEIHGHVIEREASSVPRKRSAKNGG